MIQMCFGLAEVGCIQNVACVMLHAADTLAITVATLNCPRRNDRAMIRWICNVKAKDEVSSYLCTHQCKTASKSRWSLTPTNVRSTKKNPIIHPYQIHQTTLRLTDQAKYLGVTITPDLSWKCHIDNTTEKANSTMAFLRRNIRSSQPDAKTKAYKTYVRPIVQNASSVWSPAFDCHINQLEKIQRRAARFVLNDFSQQSSVSAMISSLGWDTLQQRRDNARTTVLYKIKHNHVDITPDPPLHNARTSRGNTQQLS